MNANSAWNDNSIQFPRLLAEIAAIGLSREDKDALCASMDLEPAELEELFVRAEKEFEQMKAQIQAHGKIIKVGDTVWTTKQLFFVDGYDPNTGDEIELRFDRRDHLTVVAIGEGLRYECRTVAGMIAYLDAEDIEGV